MGIWKIDDKKWMQERKKTWKPIKQSLQESDSIERHEISTLQDYYLTGKWEESINMIFRLWLHPDQSEENWQRIISETKYSDFVESKRIFDEETVLPYNHIENYGFMGGLEKRFLKLFRPDTGDKFEFDFKGKSVQIVQPDSFFRSWFMGMRDWLTGWAYNPYYIYQYLNDLAWNTYPYTNVEESLMYNGRPEFYLRQFFIQCAYYIDPVGMPGEDTPQRLWVEKICEDLNNRELPVFLSEIWENVKTRKGRSEWTETFEEYAYDYDDDDMAHGNLEKNGYITLVAHGESPHPDYFEKTTKIYNDLGFTDTLFDANAIVELNLGEHLNPEIIKRLGYKKGDAVPGYRYRINTNADYVDSDEAIVSVDLIMPVPAPSFEMKSGTTVFFVLPRPAEPYLIDNALAYQLNVRMMRRAFKAKTSTDLLVYVDLTLGKPSAYEKANPFYQAKDQPFINSRRAFPPESKIDFPKWKGAPLPKLF